MSIAMLERAAEALDPLLERVTFVGGATVALWITDPAAPGARVTRDVDVVAEVSSLAAWYGFEDRLRSHGFRNEASSRVICRWSIGETDDELLLDVMPTDAAILGFENRWQRQAQKCAAYVELPSGRRIRAISPPYLLATKLEAWGGRGGGDHLRSHDLEDVILLADGRVEILAEVARAPTDLRSFLSGEMTKLIDAPRFLDAVDGTVGRAGRGGRPRVDLIVLPRLRELAAQR